MRLLTIIDFETVHFLPNSYLIVTRDSVVPTTAIRALEIKHTVTVTTGKVFIEIISISPVSSLDNVFTPL